MYDRVTIFPRGPWAANASLGALAYKTPKKLIILYIWLISFISCAFIYFIRALIFIDPLILIYLLIYLPVLVRLLYSNMITSLTD